ncbi:hypothetical protein H4Q26_009570 [Puccinia striiformis f. sp. tritici PST-130]|nr:hypothetical protein H4Q26_009570 [Puccinia striiformis f. sp. tritici PST-130]
MTRRRTLSTNNLLPLSDPEAIIRAANTTRRHLTQPVRPTQTPPMTDSPGNSTPNIPHLPDDSYPTVAGVAEEEDQFDAAALAAVQAELVEDGLFNYATEDLEGCYGRLDSAGVAGYEALDMQRWANEEEKYVKSSSKSSPAFRHPPYRRDSHVRSATGHKRRPNTGPILPVTLPSPRSSASGSTNPLYNPPQTAPIKRPIPPTAVHAVCAGCRKSKRKCSALGTPLLNPATTPTPVPSTAVAPPLGPTTSSVRPKPPPIPPHPIRPLPPPTPLPPTHTLTPVSANPVSNADHHTTKFRSSVRVVIPSTDHYPRRQLSRTPSPFLKVNRSINMVPRPSLIEDASRPLKRMAPREDLAEEAWNDRRARLRIDNNRILLVNTSPAVPERDPPQNPELPPMPLSCEFDDERVTFHRAFLRWFDERHVLQKFLGLPFDQPVPTSAAPIPVQTLRRAEPSTPVISLDDIGTPQGSPQAPATATSPAQDRQPAAGSDKGKARALSPPDDANAEGSLDSADGESPNTLVPFDSPIGEDDYFGVPYDRPPPTHASPPPPARQNTPLDPLCVLFPE